MCDTVADGIVARGLRRVIFRQARCQSILICSLQSFVDIQMPRYYARFAALRDTIATDSTASSGCSKYTSSMPMECKKKTISIRMFTLQTFGIDEAIGRVCSK